MLRRLAISMISLLLLAAAGENAGFNLVGLAHAQTGASSGTNFNASVGDGSIGCIYNFTGNSNTVAIVNVGGGVSGGSEYSSGAIDSSFATISAGCSSISNELILSQTGPTNSADPTASLDFKYTYNGVAYEFVGNASSTGASYTITAIAVVPTIAAAFSPTSIVAGGSSTLTLTISNSSGATQLTGVAVAASPLPSGLNGSNPATTCTGGTASFSGGNLSLSGGSIASGGSCTVTLSVSSTATSTYTYTSGVVSATGPADLTGSTATTPTGLTVNPMLTTAQAVPTTVLTAGTAATPFTPVTASGGFGTLSYALSGGTLPIELSFSTTTGQITGTPTTLLSATTFTVTVTDQTTPTAQTSSKTFSLTVSPVTLTTTQAVPTTTLTVGSAATPFTPVTASGGFGTLTYALSGGTLPTGLSFSTASGQITGTPTSLLSATIFTVTVTDQTMPTAQTSSKTFSLTVSPVTLTTTQAVPTTTLTVGSAATPFTPVTASGGFGTLTYALSGGTLPTGLSFSAASGQITGTPTTLLAATTFTVTVTDQTTPTAQTSSKTFSLAVNATTLTTAQAVATTALTAGTAATAFTPITASGGFGTLSYALSGGTLPTGLSFSTTTGQISGTPSALLAATTFTVTATDQTTPTAQTSSKTFSLAVNAVTLTTTQAVATTTATLNAAITAFTPVTASGGFGTLSYALSGGALPTGLSFSTASGQIGGTPTALLAATAFTVTVTDQTTPTAQTSSKTFSLIVVQTIPTVTAVSPNTGPTTGGTAVTISGTNFTGATSVKFGSITVASFTVMSAAKILAVAPPGSLGIVDITVRTPGGTSAVSATDQFTYAVPADSANLRKLQATVTPMAAQVWGQATVSAMQSAISEGFAGGGPLFSPSGSGVRINFSADSDDRQQQAADTAAHARNRFGSADPFSNAYGTFDTNTRGLAGPGGSRVNDSAASRTEDAFSALGYAGPVKPQPLRASEPREWLGWAEVSGATLNRWTAPAAVNAVGTAASVYGDQINFTVGLTRVLTPKFLAGVLGGWETFDYRSDAIQGHLKGEGWTVGGYAGWKLSSTIRMDAGLAYSGIGFDGTAGTASGSFAGHRVLVTGGLTGNYNSYGFLIEPSTTVYALWEHENAYTDSLGTAQAGRDFSTGRTSAGLKVAYPISWTDTVKLVPYAGIYGDYYFNADSVSLAGAAVPVTPVFAGASARSSVGVGAQFASGGQLTLGGERSGIGGNFSLWTYRARASIPFNAQ